MGEIVYNKVGTSNRKCQCTYGVKTWLAHWERGTKQTLQVGDKCFAKSCRGFVEVGAHVLHPDDLRYVWIVPFCQWHNKRPWDTPIELKDGMWLCGAAKMDCA